MKKAGILLGLAMLLTACTGDKPVVEKDVKEATVTVEEVDDKLTIQTETWNEKDDDGNEQEVKLVKHIEEGKIIRSMETREGLGEDTEREDGVIFTDEELSAMDKMTEEEFKEYVETLTEEQMEELHMLSLEEEYGVERLRALTEEEKEDLGIE